jgi:hypothetical protein
MAMDRIDAPFMKGRFELNVTVRTETQHTGVCQITHH